MSVLTLLCGPPSPAPPQDLEAWWAQHQTLAARFPRSVDLALAGGFCSDRLAWAFASGYQAACQAALPGVEGPVALCATEAEGNHPRAIRTTVEGGRVSGEKRFVTLGEAARSLAVIAREGEDAEGRPRLRVALVKADAPGVTLTPLPPTPFAPELRHARLRLDGAPAELLPGDGYTGLLRPFRSLEDLRVCAAAAGLHLRMAAEAGWDPALREAWLAFAAALRGLEDAPVDAPATALALGGVLEGMGALLQRSEASWAASPQGERWRRDAPLLGIARGAQAARLEKARRLLTAPGRAG
ncbi:MAG: acyl-CoA dehydrogenase family protein [Alphaproteobacteria bacterium]|nr:acyl-CoA dehydrogenase family protein [Alphaproteobacteria bacterium]MCB9794250.1 acyl-CoA dehydrogenase family protein [Alphaproteobacteria bacterium]